MTNIYSIGQSNFFLSFCDLSITFLAAFLNFNSNSKKALHASFFYLNLRMIILISEDYLDPL